jgi:hypothetical protein
MHTNSPLTSPTGSSLKTYKMSAELKQQLNAMGESLSTLKVHL